MRSCKFLFTGILFIAASCDSHFVTPTYAQIVSMTPLDQKIYIVQGDVLHRVEPKDGNYDRVGQTLWVGTAAVITLGDKLYIVQGGVLHRVDPKDGTYQRLGGTWPGGSIASTLPKRELDKNERLLPGYKLMSGNNQYFLSLQTDGNLVLYKVGGSAIWASNTMGKSSSYAVMQTDGNFVIYGPTGAIWATNTDGHADAHLKVGDDGDLVLFQGTNDIWGTGTNDLGPNPTSNFRTKHVEPGDWVTLETAINLETIACFVAPSGAKIKINELILSTNEQTLDGIHMKSLAPPGGFGRIQIHVKRAINVRYYWGAKASKPTVTFPGVRF